MRETIRLKHLIPILVLMLGVFESCMNINAQKAEEPCLEILTATSEIHVPGVFSNIRSNTEYGIWIQKKCKQDITLNSILVDDIILEINSIKVADKWETKNFLLSGSIDSVFVSGNQFKYNSDAPQINKVKVYKKSGIQLNGQAGIKYTKSGKVEMTQFKSLFRKDDVIHN